MEMDSTMDAGWILDERTLGQERTAEPEGYVYCVRV
jgi:hypothetical protein